MSITATRFATHIPYLAADRGSDRPADRERRGDRPLAVGMNLVGYRFSDRIALAARGRSSRDMRSGCGGSSRTSHTASPDGANPPQNAGHGSPRAVAGGRR